MTSTTSRISKFLTFILRHKPDSIGLTLDTQGWADIDELIELNRPGSSRHLRASN